VVGIWSGGLGRAYAITGYFGLLLSLGPGLHVGGHVSRVGGMPYARLVQLFPGLAFSGVPVRFGLVAQGALAIVAGLGLAAPLRRISARWVLPVAGVATALVLLELLPDPLPTSAWPVPAPMREWAKSDEDFTVIDLTGDARLLWNAIHHRHRCVGGYLTRIPKRLEDWLFNHPVFGPGGKRPQHLTRRLVRDDPTIDFDWGLESPDPAVYEDLFQVSWDGAFDVPRAGDYTFILKSDDATTVRIDGQLVVARERLGESRSAPVALTPGRHRMHVDYEEHIGNAEVHLAWQGPGLPRQILRPAPERPGDRAAFHGVYSDGDFEPSVPRPEALALLREIKVRYVVVDARGAQTPMWGGVLALPLRWEGDGVRIYEVPPPPPGVDAPPIRIR
jgi:hypothetical protein